MSKIARLLVSLHRDYSDTLLYAWGSNSYGALGTGNLTNRSSPVQVGPFSWSIVQAATDAVPGVGQVPWSVGLHTDGSLWRWGAPVEGGANIVFPTRFGTDSWSQLSARSGHALAIKSDGTLWAWGRNTNGVLGDGTTLIKYSPVQIGTSSWTQVVAGRNHSLAIRSDGTLWAWGLNSSGQLGLGLALSRSSPVQVGTSSWTNISVGTYHSVAIRSDGTLWSWGQNTTGQVGDSTAVNKSSPVQIGLGYSWTQVDCAHQTSLAIRSDGLLFGWGDNTRGIVGDGTFNSKSSPVQIGSATWTKIVGATDESTTTSYAIRTDGTLWAWGSIADATQSAGQFLINTTEYSWSQVSGSRENYLAIRSDGTLWGWGYNTSGELGDGTVTTRHSPVQIGTSSWSQVSSGGEHTVAIRSDGTLWSWGKNLSGQLGHGTIVGTSSPVQVGTSSWSQVSSGFRHTSAIRSDGTLWVWGSNEQGALGLGDLASRSSPVQVGVDSWTWIAAGYRYTAGIKTDGTLWTWGTSGYGELGHSAAATTVYSWTFVDSNYTGTRAIRSDGTLWGWGYNSTYSINDLDAIDRSSPVQIGSSNTWTKVISSTYPGSAAIGSRSFAIDQSGSLYGWGVSNTSVYAPALLGIMNRPQQGPTLVGDLIPSWNNNITSVAVGVSHSLALKSDGTLWGWGGNDQGQLIHTPSTVYSWSQVSTSRSYTLAIRSDGTLWGWGESTYHRHGIDLPKVLYSPVQIGTDSWTQITTGPTPAAHVLGIKSNGTLWGWGYNTSGQLGDGTAVSRSSPVQIGTSSWTQVDAGTYYTEAIRSDGTLWRWGAWQSTPGIASYRSSPVQVGTDTWSKLSVGHSNSLGITTDGRLMGWGDYSLLSGATPTAKSWETIVGATDYSTGTAGAGYHGITTTGQLWAWGYNAAGQLGDGTTVTKSSPVQIGSNTWSTIARHDRTTLAIRSDGTLWAWGSNDSGQLGDGTIVDRSSPVQVGTSTWTKVTAGKSFVAAIRSDGKLFTWGAGYFNSSNPEYWNLGTQDPASRSSPVQVGTDNWSDVKAGTNHVIAKKSDNTLWGWGRNTNIQVGAPTYRTFSKIQFGTSVVHAIGVDGSLWSWGNDINGQRGVNRLWVSALDTVTSFHDPIKVGTSSWSQVDAGGNISLAIRSDGILFGWGVLSGDGTAIARSSPVQIGSNTWTKVAAGYGQAYAIRSDGTLWAWGNNPEGQLGDNTNVAKSSPVQIGVGYSWTQISAGKHDSQNHVAAIRSDGTLWTWGAGDIWGMQGNNTAPLVYRSSPVQVGSLTTWSDVSVGNYHIVARIGTAMWVWGGNNQGQIGDGTTVFRSSPVQVGSGIAWGNIVAGAYHNVARSVGGDLWTWGNNGWYQLGESTNFNKSTPTLITGWGSETAAVVAAGYRHSAIIGGTTSYMYTWGFQDLRPGLDYATKSYPVMLPSAAWCFRSPTQIDSVPNWTEIQAGGDTSAATKFGTSLYVWGNAIYGQGGNGVYTSQQSPTVVGSLAGGPWTNIHLSSNGRQIYGFVSSTLYSWGSGTGGDYIGTNPTANRASPVQIGAGTTWYKVASNSTTTQLIESSNRRRWTHGGGIDRGHPYSDAGSSTIPTFIEGNYTFTFFQVEPQQMAPGSWLQVSSGFNNFAIRNDNTLWGWGNNYVYGALGMGDVLKRSVATQIGTLNTWTDVAQGLHQTTALRSDNTMWAWGFAGLSLIGGSGSPDAVGVGDGTALSRSSPVQVGSFASWNKLHKGHANTITRGAITTTGSLYLWGQGSPNGPVGSTTITQSAPGNYSVPTLLGGQVELAYFQPKQIGTNWAKMCAGTQYTVAISTAGTLWAWGNNNFGQLGDGTVISRSSPVQIGTANTWVDISAGSAHTTAIKSDGSLWSWGYNNNGQLGDGSTVSKSSPVQIGTSSWSAVASSNATSSALRSDGLMFAWGFTDGSSGGGIGDGTIGDRSSPVQIGAGVWEKISVNAGILDYNFPATGGSLQIWGPNYYGRLGLINPDTLTETLAPQELGGQLGYIASPVQVTGTWNSVATGWGMTAALNSSNNLFTWGLRTGDGTTIYRSSPVQIGSDVWSYVNFYKNVSTTTRLPESTVGVGIKDGKRWAWGQGYVGANNAGWVTYLSPTQIGTDDWISVDTNAAIRSDGKLFLWGTSPSSPMLGLDYSNSSPLATDQPRALGNTPVRNLSVPTQISTTSWTSISAGAKHILAIKSSS